MTRGGFTPDELHRYARHLALPHVGIEGQERIRAARVVCVGAGGLGSPLCMYLAAAGVGTLGVVDFDTVDVSNLQRQLLHGTRDVGRSKLDSAEERIRDLNPHVSVVRHEARLAGENALEILAGYDVVIDGTDNFPTRYLVNDACVLLGIPNVYGSIFRWEGQVSVFGAEGGPCYRCLFREPPPPGLIPNCADGGVLGVLPGIIGSLQALEVLKLILGQGDPLVGRLLIFDALEMTWREVRVRRDPGCPVCGDHPTQTGLIDYEIFCGLKAVPGSEQPGPGGPAVPEMGALELDARLAEGPAPFLLDVREPWEWAVGNLEDRGAVLIPEGQIEDRMDEIPRDGEIVVVCRSGDRSRTVARRLIEGGCPSVFSLRGGMLEWARDVDPDAVVL